MEELKKLQSMISEDRFPKMDGSHRLDHSEAIRLIQRIHSHITSLNHRINDAEFWFSLYNENHPDEVQQILQKQ